MATPQAIARDIIPPMRRFLDWIVFASAKSARRLIDSVPGSGMLEYTSGNYDLDSNLGRVRITVVQPPNIPLEDKIIPPNIPGDLDSIFSIPTADILLISQTDLISVGLSPILNSPVEFFNGPVGILMYIYLKSGTHLVITFSRRIGASEQFKTAILQSWRQG